MNHPIQRRQFARVLASSAGAIMLSSCGRPAQEGSTLQKRVLVVAFDGLDPRIVEQLIDLKRVPNFGRLARQGSMTRIATSTPPHTPVAFASIITGADPGMHQIYDFIHRDPNPSSDLAVRPYLSTAETAETKYTPTLGGWRLPYAGGETRLMRRGKPYWDYLVANGIDADVYYLPSNYPPQAPEGPGRCRIVSGMGTPDVLGSYGEFTLFTPDVSRRGRSVGGGRFERLSLRNHRGTAELSGPPNFLRSSDEYGRTPPMKIALNVVRDPVHRVAKIELSGSAVLLVEGEWSDWIPVDFPTEVPGTTLLKATGAPTLVRGMVRLFAKQIHPKFELYVSPVNIDPFQPVNSFTQPPEFSQQLARRHGRFHTLGIPEDTKALSYGALTEDQFLAQTKSALEERIGQFRHALANFQCGCLFFYFGDSDLVQHMFWRDRDPQHPAFNHEESQRYGKVVEDVYTRADRLVGEALDAIGPEDTLIVLSDHGFTSFRRGFNLNTWLLQNGYIELVDRERQAKDELFLNVAWDDTRVYGLGMNGVYVNLAGREKKGKVAAKQKQRLLNEIGEKLLEVRDDNGTQVIASVHHVEDIYPGADDQVAPDMIIGYNDGFRASWETVLGQMPSELIVDNLDRWSGTHLISADLVPGVLLSNHKISTARPALADIAPTILSEFGIAIPAEMTGRSLFTEPHHV
jgi:predicted AlkP superfamily phosphohydrolase/phosphomutase